MAQEREARINDEIIAKEVRLAGESGEQFGVVSVREALTMAEEQDMDLIEISSTARSPARGLMDYGRYKYQQAEKRDEARKNQRQVQVKGIKLRPSTDESDHQTEMCNINRFSAGGNKVKVTPHFRGHKMAHQQLGMQFLERVKEDLAEVAQIESFLKMEGHQMVMMIVSGEE